MTKLKQGTWVVVADSEKALFLKNLTDHENPNLEVIEIESQENPPSRDQGANRPGRMPDTGPGQRSAMQDTDWHELAKERFAKEVADILYTKAHAGAFDALVLVAGPKVLGHIREDLHIEVQSRVVAEIAKNLAGHTVRDIEDLVKAELDGGA